MLVYRKQLNEGANELKIYTYKQPAAIESTEAVAILNEAGRYRLLFNVFIRMA